jgi:SNF2 family DNA or RNA helicase
MITETPRLRLSLNRLAGEVRLDIGGVEGARLAELDHLLMANGALPAGGAYVVPVLSFRRASIDIAQVLTELGVPVAYDEAVEELLRTHLDEVRARRGAASLEALDADAVRLRVGESDRFTRDLTDEQVRDLGSLLALPHGANFSVPGAGKTAALLAIYETFQAQERVDRLLVVAPKNAFLSWEDEVENCFDDPEARPLVLRLTGGYRGVRAALSADPEIALITYQLLPNVLDLIRDWARRHRTHVVLDESHRIKGGPGGVLANAALQLAEVGARRDILTGTPLPHAPEDLRPQLDFLWPGHRIMPDMRVVTEAPEDLLEEVRQDVEPLYVRTTKEELNLPRLDVNPLLVDLGPLQRELYDLLRGEAARLAAGMSSRDRRFFRLLGRHVIRLLQAASNPMLLTQGELVDRAAIERPPQGVRAWELLRDLARYEQPAKIAAAIERAEEVVGNGGKVLIWSSFVHNLTSLEGLLRAHQPVVLYGQVPTGPSDDPETREGRIRVFHEDERCRVMIANPAACGEAISLHRACHHAIYVDRSFNAAHYLQSIDRIHRLGLPPKVVTYVDILEARDSIDQRVSHRLKLKIDAMSLILNDRGLQALAYDPDDVVEEFPAGLEPGDVEEVIDHLVSEPGEE